MTRTLALSLTLGAALLVTTGARADDHAKAAAAADPMASCPMHAQHMAAAQQDHLHADGSAGHGREVDGRHDTFGMPHGASTHSFRLFADGGAIELRANRADDQEAIANIRQHLEQVAGQFRTADFSTPAFVHGTSPAGVSEMARLRSDIAYRYESLPAGGRIRITASSAPALAAVHDFLRFQVTEHRTANTGKVEEDR